MTHFFGLKRKIWNNCNATLLVGRRRQGKSTLLAMIAQEAIKAGYTVYSNYPIDGTVKVPKLRLPNGDVVMDKSFLYNNPLLEHAFLLLDEVGNIWGSRSWQRWTEEDTDFFNYLGKADTKVFMAIQCYDLIDLNVKRALDATWFVVKSAWFKDVSVVECDYHDICKVEDLQTHVLDSRYRKVSYEPCEIPDGKYFFRRKPWYTYFLTLYKDERALRHYDLTYWHDLCFASDVPGASVAEPGTPEPGQEEGEKK